MVIQLNNKSSPTSVSQLIARNPGLKPIAKTTPTLNVAGVSLSFQSKPITVTPNPTIVSAVAKQNARTTITPKTGLNPVIPSGNVSIFRVAQAATAAKHGLNYTQQQYFNTLQSIKGKSDTIPLKSAIGIMDQTISNTKKFSSISNLMKKETGILPANTPTKTINFKATSSKSAFISNPSPTFKVSNTKYQINPSLKSQLTKPVPQSTFKITSPKIEPSLDMKISVQKAKESITQFQENPLKLNTYTVKPKTKTMKIMSVSPMEFNIDKWGWEIKSNNYNQGTLIDRPFKKIQISYPPDSYINRPIDPLQSGNTATYLREGYDENTAITIEGDQTGLTEVNAALRWLNSNQNKVIVNNKYKYAESEELSGLGTSFQCEQFSIESAKALKKAGIQNVYIAITDSDLSKNKKATGHAILAIKTGEKKDISGNLFSMYALIEPQATGKRKAPVLIGMLGSGDPIKSILGLPVEDIILISPESFKDVSGVYGQAILKKPETGSQPQLIAYTSIPGKLSENATIDVKIAKDTTKSDKENTIKQFMLEGYDRTTAEQLAK